ncbi:MAG: hypothetical protein WA956_06995 [Stenotrophomonas sp.]
MNRDDIDRLLGSEEQISPSPDFLASVMRAVEREAALPMPLAFPWVRALPGFAAVVIAVSGALWYLLGSLDAVARVLDEQLNWIATLIAGPTLLPLLIAIVATTMSLMISSCLVQACRGSHLNG